MTAKEIVKHGRNKAQLPSLPVVDGFAAVDQDDDSSYVSVLYWANHAYNLLLQTGYMQCYREFDLVEGTQEYRQPTDILAVHELKMIDTTAERVYYLDPHSRQRMNHDRPAQSYPAQTRRPTAFDMYADIILFDYPPDATYHIKMLCDAPPLPLALVGDVPERLKSPLHYIIGDGAAYFLSTIAMNEEAKQTEWNIARYREIKGDWVEGVKTVQRYAQHPLLYGDNKPIVNDYRLMD